VKEKGYWDENYDHSDKELLLYEFSKLTKENRGRTEGKVVWRVQSRFSTCKGFDNHTGADGSLCKSNKRDRLSFVGGYCATTKPLKYVDCEASAVY